MAAEKIGKARCPLCGGTASVSLSKSKLPVMTMNCCQAQLFTRSDRSDMLVRALMLPPEQQDTPISPKSPEVEDRGVRVVNDEAVQTSPPTTEAPARRSSWLSSLMEI